LIRIQPMLSFHSQLQYGTRISQETMTGLGETHPMRVALQQE
jgi:hypothetical protein